MNPPYDVEFNARINIAGVFDVNSRKSEEMKKELEKMLRDSKNKDFQDQIYYALGNLAMKEGKEKEALEYYQKISNSKFTESEPERQIITLPLPNYYYEKPDYMKAGKVLRQHCIFS